MKHFLIELREMGIGTASTFYYMAFVSISIPGPSPPPTAPIAVLNPNNVHSVHSTAAMASAQPQNNNKTPCWGFVYYELGE